MMAHMIWPISNRIFINPTVNLTLIRISSYPYFSPSIRPRISTPNYFIQNPDVTPIQISDKYMFQPY